MHILMVLTSHDRLGDSLEPTGFWLEEFAAPYYAFVDAGAEVTVVSPVGGQPPLDPKSDRADAQTDATRRFKDDPRAQQVLAHTGLLSEVSAADFDAVFFPGGHGPLWDLTNNEDSIRLLQAFEKQRKPIAAVCHAPAVFAKVKKGDGEPLVKGKNVTGFTNTEEAAVNLTEVVPFLVEDKLKELGGHYSKVADWQPHVVRDGILITGQNPASSEGAAEELLRLMNR